MVLKLEEPAERMILTEMSFILSRYMGNELLNSVLSLLLLVLVSSLAIEYAGEGRGVQRERAKALRTDWASGQVHGSLAQRIAQQLSNCSRPYYYQLTDYGLGSNLHTWSQALCNAFGRGGTLQQLPDPWIWNDQQFCRGRTSPPLYCYFNLQNNCVIENEDMEVEIVDHNNNIKNCPEWVEDDSSRQEFRAAAMEVLFSNLSLSLVHEAEDTALRLFGPNGAPEDMITVHIRRGDKRDEMELPSMAIFVDAIRNLTLQYQIALPVHLFVITESPDVIMDFQSELHQQGLRYVLYHIDQPINSNNQSSHTHSPPKLAKLTHGATGKTSLVSLLLGLEARFYILTTGSNWSRLIDELRRNKVNYNGYYSNPSSEMKCSKRCTVMVDLMHAFRFHNW
jgi:hypothetical protein